MLPPKLPLKPAPKAEPKPKAKGLFGEKKCRSFVELRQFARKAPYERIPKHARRLGKKERMSFMDALKKYSGQSYGLSETKFNLALLRMKKEKMYTKDYKKKKELDQQIRMLEKWKKGE